MQPELIADYHCVTGEGPLWHPKESRLYWADIPEGRLFRYNPFTRVHEQIYDGRVVGGYTIQADGSLLLFMDRCSVAVLRDGELDFIVDELPDEADNRFNDVIADPAGRVFCGTMPQPQRSSGHTVSHGHRRVHHSGARRPRTMQRHGIHLRRQEYVLHGLTRA